MRVSLKLISARFNRWSYLLFIGMWKGECALDLYGSNGWNLMTGTGSIWDETWKTKQVFYGDDCAQQFMDMANIKPSPDPIKFNPPEP